MSSKAFQLNTFQAVGITHYLSVENPDCFQIVNLPMPVVGSTDLLVQIKAFSVNPIDTKLRLPKSEQGKGVEGGIRILGWDAAGVVVAKGEKVSGFSVGDEVFYAGQLNRPGSNATHQLVDYRLVAHKPKTLSMRESAALPLTALTTWELLERMNLHEQSWEKTVLVIGGAGGVGSIMIQRLKQIGKRVIATASRGMSKDWCLQLGADEVINPRQGLTQGLTQIGLSSVDAILNLVDTNGYWDESVSLLTSEGAIGLIVAPVSPLDLAGLRNKSARVAMEFMFTRGLSNQPARMELQGEILKQVAYSVDQGQLKSTLKETLIGLNTDNLRQAHTKLEQQSMIGKLVVEVGSVSE